MLLLMFLFPNSFLWVPNGTFPLVFLRSHCRSSPHQSYFQPLYITVLFTALSSPTPFDGPKRDQGASFPKPVVLDTLPPKGSASMWRER